MAEVKRFYVYVLYRETGVPFYVGRGTGGRWLQHESAAFNDKSCGNPHKQSIIKNILRAGLMLDKRKVAVFATTKEAAEHEAFLIKQIGREPVGPLVNMTDGGDGGLPGYKFSEATKKKISDAHIGRPKSDSARANMSRASKGRDYSLQTAAMRKANLGRPCSEETKKKISDMCKGCKLSPEHVAKLRGKKRSAAARKNISDSLIGRKVSAAHLEKMRTRDLSKQVAAMAAATRGRKKSEAVRDNMRAAWVKRRITYPIHANQGRKDSDEVRANKRAGWIKRKEAERVNADA